MLELESESGYGRIAPLNEIEGGASSLGLSESWERFLGRIVSACLPRLSIDGDDSGPAPSPGLDASLLLTESEKVDEEEASSKSASIELACDGPRLCLCWVPGPANVTLFPILLLVRARGGSMERGLGVSVRDDEMSLPYIGMLGLPCR